MGNEKRVWIFGVSAGLWIVGVIAAAIVFRSHRSEYERTHGVPGALPEAASDAPSQTSAVALNDDKKKPDKSAAVELFNGKTLDGWSVADKHFFADSGKVSVKDGVLILEAGTPGTGVRCENPFPKINYEVSLQAQRIEGNDFFCGMTFPVNDSHCSLILGGWGGTVVGLSNVDGESAVDNETATGMTFKNGRWYDIRLRVADDGIKVWIDGEVLIDLESLEHQFDIWWEQEPMKPFGIASWYTKAGLRNIKLQRLDKAETKEKSSSDQAAAPAPRQSSQG